MHSETTATDPQRVRQPIALFVNSFGGGGAEKNVVLLANGMVGRGYDVDVFVEHDRGSYRAMLSPKVKVISFGTSSPFKILQGLCRYFKQTPPRAFYGHLEKPALLAIVAGLITGYRRIVPALHVDLNSYAKIDHQTRRTLLKILLGVFYRFAARVQSVSYGCTNSLAPLLGPKHAKRIITVYNGFDLEALRAAAKEPVDHPLLTHKTKPVFLGCGRLSEQKNFSMLIKAFAELRKTHDASLIILGEGPQREMLTALAKELRVADDVHMPGFVNNPFAWFGKCDTFVLSSKSEGLANVIVEAMTAGARMIATRCPSGPEEILQNGKYGALVEVDDVQGMAAAMRDVLDGKPEPASQAEIQAYLDRTFAFDIMLDGHIRVALEAEADYPAA
jgi:glycosyltransferase involved in cell wall biosynthesis